MLRPFALLLLITGLFVGIIGAAWLGQPPSNQELLANYAKTQDYANTAVAVGGVPWWSPNFLMGGSLTFQSLWAFSDLGVYVGSLCAGQLIGPKLAALAFLLLCPFTMYGFVRRLCPEKPWAAFACGLAFLFSPPVLFRMAAVEHVNMVLGMALTPVVFLGVLIFIEKRTYYSAVLCAVSVALMALSYAKPTILLMPLLAIFALWAWAERGHFQLPHWKVILTCAGVFFVLAVLPNLPTLREMKLTAGFTHGPFAGWQLAYSSKSALSWLDYGGVLTGSSGSPQSDVRTPSTYLGIIAMACVTAVFFLRRRPFWNTQPATVFRLFVGLSLVAQWFGFGVHNALTAHLAFLKTSAMALDPAIALAWALLVLQGVAIFIITPGSLPGRRWWSVAAVLLYFLVPGFRLMEKFPFFGDIRAPHDFFEISGTFCVAMAVGLAAYLFVTTLPGMLRAAATAGLVILAAADATTAIPSLFHSKLSLQTFTDFEAAQKFLKESPVAGRVMPYSGRYFYLLTPVFSGRPIVTEAFNNYLTLRKIAELQDVSTMSKEDYQAYLDVTGVTWVLLDKKDPDTPKELQDTMREIYPVAFENDHIAILKNESALAPAAFAKNYTVVNEPTPETALNALRAAGQSIGSISLRSVYDDSDGAVPWKEKKNTALSPIEKISPTAYQRPNAQRIIVTPPSDTGWILIPEAFHPDWRAFQDGKPLELAHSFHALLGVRVHGSKQPVTLTFQPPWWFGVCIWTSLLGWIGTLGFLGVNRFLPARPAGAETDVANLAAPTSAAPVRRAVVLIPTYNEASSIVKTLDVTLGAHPTIEILVLDDASPDGTAELVRQHPAFRQRVHLTERPGKMGLGNAYKAGFKWAQEQNFDACIEMDADLSHNPEDIPRLLAALESGADVAIGSRYLGGVRVINWPSDRLFLSLGATKFVGLVTRLPLTDATSGFKAIRCEVLKKLNWSKFKADGYGFQIELHYFLWKSGAKLVEVPIVFTERREGKTKMTPGIAVEALTRVLRLAVFRR